MKYQPRKPPEGINSSQDSPLTDALYLILYTTLGLCVLYLGLSFLSQQVVAQISLQQEVDFFRSSKQEENASPLEQKMQKLTNQLWSHYDEAKNIQIETRIKKSDQLNAFMKMGGRMELTQGLVHKMENENALAFVICHEIGHFYHRHVIEGVGREAGFSLTLRLLGLSNNNRFIDASAQSLKMSFSRKQEAEADHFALNCMEQHYGHVNGYDHFFKYVLKKEMIKSKIGKKILGFSQTHPLTENRIKKLETKIKDLKYKDRGELTIKGF